MAVRAVPRAPDCSQSQQPAGGAAANGRSPQSLGFRHHPAAVQYPAHEEDSGGEPGLNALVPYGQCVLGVGKYANGFRDVTANWMGNADCTRLRLDPAPSSAREDVPQDWAPNQGQGGWSGGGVGGQAVLAGPDGSVLGADTHLVRRTADGEVETLADLEVPTGDRKPGVDPATADGGGARAMVRGGKRLLIGGGVSVRRRNSPVLRRNSPVLWVSTDGGRSVERTTLPRPPGFAADGSGPWLSGVTAMAADGERVVALGSAPDDGPRRVPVWTSTDGGRTWQASTAGPIAKGATISGVLRDGNRCLAYGGRLRYGARDLPFAMTSADGRTRKTEDVSAMGEGWIAGAVVDGGGQLVLLGRVMKDREWCGTVWTGGIGKRAERAALGCGRAHPTAVGTRADGVAVIAGGKDLWVRDGKRTG